MVATDAIPAADRLPGTGRRIGVLALQGDFAEHRSNVVACYESGNGRAGFASVALVVVGDEADLLAFDAAGFVDLLKSQLDPVVGRAAECRLRTGHRGVVTKDDFVGVAIDAVCA